MMLSKVGGQRPHESILRITTGLDFVRLIDFISTGRVHHKVQVTCHIISFIILQIASTETQIE